MSETLTHYYTQRIFSFEYYAGGSILLCIWIVYGFEYWDDFDASYRICAT